jgi:hypothetical protein
VAILTQYDVLTEVARINGQFVSAFQEVRANHRGDFVYVQDNIGGDLFDKAVFVNGTRLVGAGDVIDGHRVTSVGSTVDINDRGEIAFTAVFGDDDIDVVVIARVPEPAAWQLVVLSILTLGSYRCLIHRRCRNDT